MKYTEFREPPPKRKPYCETGMEQHFTEGAVMLAFAIHLLKQGAMYVELHPDGEHTKKFNLCENLAAFGFSKVSSHGKTSHGGVYQRQQQSIAIIFTPGHGDVVATINNRPLFAECKGGVINSRHPGQTARLRRGLCEAVGQLMTRPSGGARHIAVVPTTRTTKDLAFKMIPRILEAKIEIALIDEYGEVEFIAKSDVR